MYIGKHTHTDTFCCVPYPLDVNNHEEVFTGLIGYIHLMVCEVSFGLFDA